MLFNTPQFVMWIIIISILFYISPKHFRCIFLCAINFVYAWFLGGKSTLLILLTVTIVTYLTGLLMEKVQWKKTLLFLFCVIVLSILFYGKYINFVFSTITRITNYELKPVSVVAMIGVSYYVFSAISYVVDIMKNKDEADRNIIHVTLWLTFFGKLIAGPIERHCDFKKQIIKMNTVSFEGERIKRGFLIVAGGYFQKIIIADRLGILVDHVWSNITDYEGLTLFIIMILYSMQIYMDFAGYSNIAIGVAHIFGIHLTKNFDCPYFSISVTEFWRKWHISLSSWLKEYIYIPLGGNRKGNARQYLNLMLTFLISGLWHGAAWTYIVWGGLHGLFQIVEKIFQRKTRNVCKSKTANCILTFLLVSVAWVFFRAPSVRDATIFFGRMLKSFNPWILSDGTLTSMGLDILDWGVLLVAIVIAGFVDALRVKGVSIYDKLQTQNIVVRWMVYYVIIIGLLVFGIYGATYDSASFIYFQY